MHTKLLSISLISVVLFGGLAVVRLNRVNADAASSAPPAKAPAAEADDNWSMWLGSPGRNNTPDAQGIPSEWNIGEIDYKTNEWISEGAENIKWASKLGSRSYGSCVVHNGKVLVGTNNTAGYLKRYPAKVDLGCLICFDVRDGKFLWQHSSEKLPSGRVHDWPHEGVCSVPVCEGDRLWFVTNRCEVHCVDVEGFLDNENDGPFVDEQAETNQEADIIWKFDMMKELGVSPHNMSSCSCLIVGDTLFVCTSNGIDEEHKFVPAPEAPSFIAMDKNTAKVLWSDNSPGGNIHHGQWSSPAYGEFDGQAQIIFGGGDGWIYSFDPNGDGNGNSKLLWKFDANPKTATLALGGAGTRNDIIATPVIYEGKVYIATGQDPEHGEGVGILWCIDPTKRGDVSPQLAFNANDPKKPIPYKRVQAVVEKEGDFARDNKNSAALWKFDLQDANEDGEVAFEETMHRTIGSVAIKDGLLYVADICGMFYCLDAKTGKIKWSYDLLAATWSTPLIVEGKVYIGDEDGEVAVFRHSGDPNEAMKEQDGEMQPYYGTQSMASNVYSTPVVAGGVLYISNPTHLFAISSDGK